MAARTGSGAESGRGGVENPASDVPEQVRALLDERRSLTNEVAQLRELAMSGGGATAPKREVNGVKFVGQVLSGITGKDLPGLVDERKAMLGSGAVLLIADTGGKAAVAGGVTKDLTDALGGRHGESGGAELVERRRWPTRHGAGRRRFGGECRSGDCRG